MSYQKYNPAFAPELLQRNFSEAKPIKSSSPSDFSLSDRLPEVSAARNAILPPNSKLNLNAATQDELEKLPHLGPVLAKRIIDYRYEKGGFDSVEEIIRVKGIGKKIFAQIKDYLTLE